MRSDTAGMFWDDTPPPKILKEKVKRTPPERVWERPDYLPHLDKARALKPALMHPQELLTAAAKRQPLIYDCEVYPNFFLVSFVNYETGKAVCFEMSQKCPQLDRGGLHWLFTSCLLVGFNNLFYDSNIIALAIAGHSTETLYDATVRMISYGERPEDVLESYGVEKPIRDEIDLIEVAPLQANLKTYGGRLHAPTLQDLPFPVGTWLTEDQQAIVRWYNLQGDIVDTAIIYRELKKQLDLRVLMSTRYGVDLRSKSDAQMAEAVIRAEVKRRTGKHRIKVPSYPPGTTFFLKHEPYIQFQTPALQRIYRQILESPFTLDDEGNVVSPPSLSDQLIPIGRSVYRVGLGGLHSTEKQQVRHSDANGQLYDRDVASYYPRRILNVGMFPPQIGELFLLIYEVIIDERLGCKRKGLKEIAECLKIVVNGVFGKLLSIWSAMFAPHMGIQVTVGGQLCLLMLIEAFELSGIEVISANTDGVTSYVPNHLHDVYLQVIKWWEKTVHLETEEKKYRSLYSRDVNNYMAVDDKGKIKAKGAYLNAYKDPDLAIFRFHKNPVNTICLEALEAYLVHGVPLRETVQKCKDICKFVTVRTVKGGGVKDGEYLGKTVRWYYAKEETGEIIYAKTGNKVARSDGAKPCMELPQAFPDDVDLDWYVREADSLLQNFGLPTTLENVPCMTQ